MADDKNRLRKTYSFFRQQPVYASGGGGGGGGGTSDQFWYSTTVGSIYTTGSVAIRGGSTGVDAPGDIGDGVFFYVSGSIDAKNINYTNVSVFGGDVIVSGSVRSLTALSGSLTKLADGTSYLIAGSNITIASASNGGVTISAAGTVPGGSDTQVQFNDGGSSLGGDVGLTYNKNTYTLTGVNVVLLGDLTVSGTMTTVNTTNLEIKDSVIGLGFASGTVAQTAGDRGWIGSNVTAGIDTHVMNKWDNTNSEFVFARTTSSATGSFAISSYSNLQANNIQGRIISASLGFSGSLTKLINGTSYLVAGNNVIISTGSSGQVTISSTASGGGGGDPDATYLVLSATGSLSSERVLTPGTGLSLNDAGAGGNATLSINDTIVATVSGTTFTGVTRHNAGLSGSLTKLSDGTSYLIAGSGVNISSASNGAVTLSTTGAAVVAGNNTEIQFNSNGSFDSSANLNFNSSTSRLSLTGSFGMQGDIIPDSDTTHNLGSSEKRWANVYTGDLHLRNDRGDWTIVEERDYLCVVNNITGKKYKMMLQPIDSEYF